MSSAHPLPTHYPPYPGFPIPRSDAFFVPTDPWVPLCAPPSSTSIVPHRDIITILFPSGFPWFASFPKNTPSIDLLWTSRVTSHIDTLCAGMAHSRTSFFAPAWHECSHFSLLGIVSICSSTLTDVLPVRFRYFPNGITGGFPDISCLCV